MSGVTPINTAPEHAQEDVLSLLLAMSASASTSASTAASAPDPRAANLVCPSITDASKFWHVTQERWNELLIESGKGPATGKNNALALLRKYDACGRIMEGEGIRPAVECSACAGLVDPCMIFPDGGPCACCKRNQKSGCNASIQPLPRSLEDHVAALETELAAASAAVEQLQQRQQQQLELIQALQATVNRLSTIEVWRR